jgi:hypothetical protein
MRTTALTAFWTLVAAITYACLFGLIWVASSGLDWLIVGWHWSFLAAALFHIAPWAFCYLPALLTGMILRHVAGAFQLGATAPLGVIASLALLVHAKLCISLPQPLTIGSFGDVCPSFFILLSAGLMAQFALDWKFPPRWWNPWFIAIFTWLVVLVAMSVASALLTSAQALLSGT